MQLYDQHRTARRRLSDRRDSWRTLVGLSRPQWLDPSELRIGLGCMRLPSDASEGQQAIATAIGAGITVFDTARAYGPGEGGHGDNERLVAGSLRRCGAERTARIVTKGAMTRLGAGWVPDGRAKAILSDCEASLSALDGIPIDTYLIHTPDPRTPWRTSVRALARLVEEGLVARVGLSNVNRPQLDEALALASISAVEVAISLYDHRALRGGIVERCTEMGIAVIAHSPLGGPRRAIGLARSRPLAEVADAHGVAPSEVALAWVLGLSEAVIAIPGARRPETVRSAARAAKLSLDADDRAILAQAFGGSQPARRQPPARSDDAAVILVMGIPGAGKSRLAREYVGRGYVRLNRDERGGSLRQIAGALDQQMSSGVRHVVVDNTYLTRAARSYVVEAASRYGIPTHCIWLSTPLAQAQVNLVGRLLELVGRLPTPDELRTLARGSEGVLMPTSQMRAARELEPPSLEEGFASVQVKPFARPQPSGPTRTGVFVAAAALRESDWELAIAQGNGKAPHLVFDWTPDGAADMLDAWVSRLAAVVSGPVEGALCPHATGPPRCWCRPPLPGLPLAFARAHGLEPSGSILIGARPAHRTLAATLGAHYVSV